MHATVSKQIHKETDSSMLGHFTREIKNTYQLWKFVNIRCSGDPVRNYGTLSSFYQMIVITSSHFTILPLAFYLD